MNSTSEVIIRQLRNEGVDCRKAFGLYWVDMRNHSRSTDLGMGETQWEAVNEALSHSIRITALLSKLRDSMPEWVQGELGDLLVEPQEVR